jgi:hypothetical protein
LRGVENYFSQIKQKRARVRIAAALIPIRRFDHRRAPLRFYTG